MIRPLQTSHNRAGKGSEKEGGKWKMKVPSFARRQNCHNKRPNHLEHAPHVRAWTPSSGGFRVSADCSRLHFVPKSHFLWRPPRYVFTPCYQNMRGAQLICKYAHTWRQNQHLHQSLESTWARAVTSREGEARETTGRQGKQARAGDDSCAPWR